MKTRKWYHRLLGLGLSLVLLLSLLSVGGCKKEPEGPFPVIIVPGILGSELQKDGNTLWPVNMADGALGMLQTIGNLMALKVEDGVEDGIAPVRLAMSDYQEGMKVGSLGAYTTLAVALADTLGYDQVFFFGYDWRQSNLETAQELSTYIDGVLETTGAKKVNLVVHSMGGLVAGGYLSGHKEEGKLAKVVTCGTPFVGAEDATESLDHCGGFFDFSDYPQLLPTMEEVFRSAPSLYELMPRSGWDSLDLLQEDGTLHPEATSAEKKAFTYYQTVTANLSDLWSGVDHVNLNGTSFSTTDPSGEVDGDGTVTLTSSTADGLFDSCTTTFTSNHTGLVKDASPVQFIVDAVKGEE